MRIQVVVKTDIHVPIELIQNVSNPRATRAQSELAQVFSQGESREYDLESHKLTISVSRFRTLLESSTMLERTEIKGGSEGLESKSSIFRFTMERSHLV